MATHTTPNNHVCTYTYDMRDVTPDKKKRPPRTGG